MDGIRIQFIDILVIVAYFIGVVSLGLWIARKKIAGGRDYFLASREMTWPLVGASLFSTNISSQQFVGQAGMAFTLGIVVGAFQMIGGMCFLFLAVFFLDTYMSLKLFTSPEFFERRFSRGNRVFVSLINILIIMMGNVAASFYGGAVVLSALLGWDVSPHSNELFWAAVILIGVTTGSYTLLGGLRSVIYTDFVQAFILIAGGAITLIAGMAKVGGPHALFGLADASGASMWSIIRPWSHQLGWLPLLSGVFILGVHGHCTDHDYIQRCLSAKNLYHAKMGAVFASFLKVSALFIIVMPGVIAARLYPDLKTPDSAYARLLIDVIPVGLSGLCLAGLLAAIQSSVSSGLSATGSLLSYDFVLRHVKDPSDRKALVLGRLIVLVLLILSMVWAPFIRHSTLLYSYLIKVWTYTAPPVFVCVLFGLYYKWANAKAALATMFEGAALSIAGVSTLNLKYAPFPQWKDHLPVYLKNDLNMSFIITLVCVAIMLIVSHATGATQEDLEKAEAIRRSRAVDLAPMSRLETIKYRSTVAVFLLVWVAVLLTFSPLGLGRAPR
ncbi:MAG: sodium/solute symporter [Candidatus Sumerlaeota bacterium]|nr:sodium/solute symporter [Candidatus Sumerlaeota bacterium]